MNTIDHRILIENRSSAVVWDQISDISKNPAWQTDCAGISFLSSRKNGVGMRWRYTSKNKREYVVETTAWYDGLGYEYTIVDGGSYRECRGRIRLQEIAEGTIVRWTFNYEMKGFMGGVRNALAHRRTLEKDMIDSLKSFWRYMNQVKSSTDDFAARSLMRDAPNYEARSHYKPRHPSAIHEDEHLAAEGVTSPAPVIAEPPVQEEDTKPHGIPKEPLKEMPARTSPEDQPVIEAVASEPEPDFMRAIPEPVAEPPEDTARSPKEQQEALAVVEEHPVEEPPLTPPEPLPPEPVTPKADPIPAKEPVLPDVT
ncbi:MAG: SRPBCC family protein, partial [Anaerolineae bacterium]|nr:SRPBCC family protein [Anaerolineae bacterium]